MLLVYEEALQKSALAARMYAQRFPARFYPRKEFFILV